jgi:DNA-binding beta-propeller fold protein YncE
MSAEAHPLARMLSAINGGTFATTDVGTGSNANVDLKSSRYWAANVYDGGVIVRDGVTNGIITTVPLGDCPVGTSYDFNRNRVWIGAQCGGGNDPVFAVDAATFNVVAGPIGTGGIFGVLIATGVLYLETSGVSKRVDPATFAITTNAFGTVRAINCLTNRLYASGGSNLQILNGATYPETILATILLSYSPASMGINTELNHLYLANPVAQTIEVRNGSTGALITTFGLGHFGYTPNGGMAVDSIRGRVYVIVSTSSGRLLLVIEDLITARRPSANLG